MNMNENREYIEDMSEDKREEIKQKLRQYYDGRIVRKDLTKSIREGANVPVYVLDSTVILMMKRSLKRV